MNALIRKNGLLGVELLINGVTYSATRAAENANAEGWITEGEVSSELYATSPTNQKNAHVMGGVTGFGVIERQAVGVAQMITRDWQSADQEWLNAFMAAIGGLEALEKASNDEANDNFAAVASALTEFHAANAATKAAKLSLAEAKAKASAEILALAKRPIPKGGREARVGAIFALGAKLRLSESEVSRIAKDYV